MSKPLVIDLCCGLGGWSKGFLAEGYRAIGFDTVRHDYPGELVLQDARTVCGMRLRQLHPAVVVASPPCQEFSRHDQPWTKKRNPPAPDLSIVEACFRIAKEAGIPIVLENVRGAQPFIGKARAHFGSQYLWGDVPALLPAGRQRKGFTWWGTEGSRQADVVPRQKQSRTSAAVAERSEIPFDLAQWIARCFHP